MFDWFYNSVLSWLAQAAAAAVQHLWDGLAVTVLANPDVTLLPQVTTISSRSLVVANTCYVLVILAAAELVVGLLAARPLTLPRSPSATRVSETGHTSRAI
jgi:hypothetical protein